MPDTDALIPALYKELHVRAAKLVRRSGGSASPSSLLQESLIRLWKSDKDAWESEEHFRSVAAMAMRQVLIDRARARTREKRGGDRQRVTLSQVDPLVPNLDALALNQAIEKLEAVRPRCASVVVMRILGGLEVTEVAELLGISEATVKRDWRTGRAFLISQLS